MLNVFPIQFLAPLAYAILRVCVGFVFLFLSKQHLRNRVSLGEAFQTARIPFSFGFVWQLALLELVVGVMFLLGFYTQIAALLALLYVCKLILLRRRVSHPLIPSRLSLVLIFFISLSLFITGAGIFAFDLPI